MGFLNTYSSPAENFIIWGAAGTFCLFTVFVLAARLASGNEPYTRINRAHKLFFIPYLAGALLFAFRSGELKTALLPALAVGCFVYFSLHYVYLFALVGLVKKSISINLLADIYGLARVGGNGVAPAAFMAHEKEKLAFIRADRLAQLTLLKMAEEKDGRYTVTARGRLLNGLGRLILRTWNLERL